MFSRVNIFAPSKGMQISAAAVATQLQARKLMWFQTRFSKHHRGEERGATFDTAGLFVWARERRSLKNIPCIAAFLFFHATWWRLEGGS